MEIVGRKQELELLQKVLQSDTAEFLAVYGRRRIGKTYIIRNFFRDKGIYLELTGVRDEPMSAQLKNFAQVYADLFNKGLVEQIPKNWSDAFEILRKKITQIGTAGKIILFFDELPWLATRRSDFLSALDYFWNRYISDMPNVAVIVCGSAAAWMLENIVSDKGGLHGRVTRMLHMRPFDLHDTKQFLLSRGVNLENKQIIELYLTMGGVAKYLTQAERGKSPAQIVNEVCFSSSTGYLFREFYKLYRSLFNNWRDHVAVVRALAQKHTGLTREALIKATKQKSGGHFDSTLRELIESGFLMEVPTGKAKSRNKLYRLIDEYSLFFLTWIEDVPSYGFHPVSQDYWLRQSAKQNWKSWSGYAFEGLCLKHIMQIKAALGIRGVHSEEFTWRSSTNTADSRAQLDLVIDRADGCINLCEIKFHDSPITITKSLAAELDRKRAAFREETRTKKTLFLTMVTPHGVKQDHRYYQIVHSQVTGEDFFMPLR